MDELLWLEVYSITHIWIPIRRTDYPISSYRWYYQYDKEKCRDLLLDAAETVLGYFGFDGSIYRKYENKAIRSSKQRKWWDELREERRKDIEAERNSN